MLTLSAIKADVGGIGGHTRPSVNMMEVASTQMELARGEGLIIDFDVTYTGDDICLLMVHDHGNGHSDIHNLAWRVFEDAAQIAKEEGLKSALLWRDGPFEDYSARP